MRARSICGSACRRVLAALGRRLRDERGVALVMSLGTTTVLSIGLTGTIYMTSEGKRHAQSSNADQQAYALAEAGINNAIATLVVQYPSVNRWGNGGTSFTGTPVTDAIGTMTWSATYNATDRRWEVTGIGSVTNPTGPNTAPVARTAHAKIAPGILSTWSSYGLFSGDPTAACTDLKGGISVNVPIYIASCL